MRKTDFLHKKFAPLLDRTLQQALAHRMATEFPRLGGPRTLNLYAQMILEVLEQHLRSRESVTHGQALWMAVSLHDPPARGKRMANTELRPVVLDLSTPEDIQAILARQSPTDRLQRKALRLCQQAHQQGALLGNCDLAELLNVDPRKVSHLLTQHERQQGTVVPRRATLHDLGSGLTHKRIICWKRYAQGKAPDQIARETYHSLEAVDHYLAQFDRVRCCLRQNLSPQQIAYTLDCSLGLVQQYLDIEQELEQHRAPEPPQS